MKALKINNFIKLILIIIVILFAIYVWPTPYKYIGSGYPFPQEYNARDSNIPFRIHRVTGRGEIWWYGEGGSMGWTKLK
ncbi:MAG: hypothetical protein IMZ60_01920 [Actinobacteria bacterium]|nr:hypothetical protein [Actinomycetota bacterium]